jgi:ParB family chromosome partitioning protein
MELELHQISKKYTGLRISLKSYQRQLLASLASEGQLQPVLVVSGSGERETSYVLIDGYQRVNALETLCRDTVETLVLPLEEPAALLFRHCQESARARTALEDGWLLRELIELHGMSQAELSRRLQRSESWVSRRLSLVRELPESAQELVRKGELSGYGAMKYLVPLARAKASACKELVSHLSGRRTSARELEQVYTSWKQGDGEQRKRVVSNPGLFLKASEALKKGSIKGVGNALSDVSKDMEILDMVSGRARRRIRGISGELPAPVIEGWRAASSSFSALQEMMERRIDVGSGDTGSHSSAQG